MKIVMSISVEEETARWLKNYRKNRISEFVNSAIVKKIAEENNIGFFKKRLEKIHDEENDVKKTISQMEKELEEKRLQKEAEKRFNENNINEMMERKRKRHEEMDKIPEIQEIIREAEARKINAQNNKWFSEKVEALKAKNLKFGLADLYGYFRFKNFKYGEESKKEND